MVTGLQTKVQMLDIYDLYHKMENSKIMLSFKGEITSELMTSILQIMESRMENMREEPKVKKKVYNVLVECLQNLYHHVDEVDEKIPLNGNDKSSAIFMIGLDRNGYSIMTGNYIMNDNIPAFEELLEKINSMEGSELKMLYRNILSNDEVSDKGGGGLGMIDIARKTGQRLDFEFTQVTEDYSFFSLNIKVEN